MNRNGRILTREYQHVTFHISENKAAVSTRLQFFVIAPRDKYSMTAHKDVLLSIRKRKVKCMNDLIASGNNRIALIPSKKEWFYEW